MGFISLKSIGSGLLNVAKNLGAQVIKAATPVAISTLQGIADKFIGSAGSALGGLTSMLPSPLKALADKYLPKGIEALTNLANGGIEKFLNSISSSITSRLVPGTGDVASLPGIGTQARADAITANTPSAAPSAPTTTSTAAAATGPDLGSGSASFVGGGNWGASGKAPDPRDSKYDMNTIEGQAQFNADSANYQRAMANMQNYFTMITNMISSQKQTASQIFGNFR